MKNTIQTICIISVSTCLLSIITSCSPAIEGEGPIVETIKDADKFSKLDLQMEANVNISQGIENSAIVHAQQNIADAISFTVTGRTLRIYSKSNLSPSEPVTIDITMNNLEAIELSGSGMIKSTGTLKSPDLNLKVSGSGKMFIDAVCNKIKSDISGSGEITLKGSATESDLNISGSGTIYAFDLIAQNSEAGISGSGDIETTAISQLGAKISGSGNITYRGNPSKMRKK